MRNGAAVAEFERAFASYVGARFAIALVNGTATLHTALVALGVKPGDKVAVPPLTMSATTIAVLQAGAVPHFADVNPKTWLLDGVTGPCLIRAIVPVSLYGLHAQTGGEAGRLFGGLVIDDAAQTLRKHSGCAFTSYSFQASKILSTGEGGMLVTDDEQLATKAREFSSLGYRMRADQPRIDPATIKSPTFDRHHSLGWNYRMSDIVAAEGLRQLVRFDHTPTRGTACIADDLLDKRREAASLYHDVIDNTGCDWLTPQHVPEGWTHDYWTFAVACDTPERALALADAVVHFGGERPYFAWRLTYDEPAFKHLSGDWLSDFAAYTNEAPPKVSCPVAESLQPRLLQFQTNTVAMAEQNAYALRRAIRTMWTPPEPIRDPRTDATGIPCG